MPSVTNPKANPFLYERAQLEDIAVTTLTSAQMLGASDAVVNVSEEDDLSVSVRHGQLDVMQRHRSKVFSVTLYAGHHRGSGSSTDFTPGAIKATLEAAWHIASFTASDSCAGPAEAEFLEVAPPDLDLLHPWEISPEEAIDLARQIESAALATSPLIISGGDAVADEHGSPTLNSGGASVSTHLSQFFMATSRGFRGGYAQSMHSMGCRVIAGNANGMQTGSWGMVRRAAEDIDSTETLGRQAAVRALARLNARRLPTGAWPVLFEAPIAGSLVGAMVSASSGDAQYRRQTFLPESLGHLVMADHLSLTEVAHERRGLASAPFDAEGVRTKDRIVVESGVLRGYFLSSYSARKLGLPTTGHAGGAHNLRLFSRLTSESDGLATMLGKLGTGVLVTELMSQGINPVTGDYSRGVSGFWVEGGKILYPVEEITIAGNLKDMLRGIVAVGSDTLLQGAVRTGSILVDRMQIAGL
jgi:PmbA protein